MSKLRVVRWDKERRAECPEMKEFLFWCPGCDGHHLIRTGSNTSPNWSWNGSLDKPTFSPSYLCGGHEYDEFGSRIKEFVKLRCHSFIENGAIRFLDDCYHHLKGQTVELPDNKYVNEDIVDGD